MLVKYEIALLRVEQIYQCGWDMWGMSVSAVVNFWLEGEKVTNVNLQDCVPLPREGEVVQLETKYRVDEVTHDYGHSDGSGTLIEAPEVHVTLKAV
jgi:hypothetical protein